jgi:hypothetical protein
MASSSSNEIVEIYLKDSKFATPDRKYEWKGFVSQSLILSCESWNCGTYGPGKDPMAFLVKNAQEEARGMDANAIIDATLKDVHVEKSVSNVSAGANDKAVTIIREFYGIAVRFI